MWTEGQGFDSSWDAVWTSRGKTTEEGYVVLMTIPFRSLRFPRETDQTWGFVLVRDIPRNNETSFWPQVSSRVQGRLNQGATLRGLTGISPGRNVQLIPYATALGFRTLDDDDTPEFARDSFDPNIGLDAKMVLKDSLALDLTVNPDFSQVESDQPQVTVNERFEVFFPEKRPFFLENADLFNTHFNLLFTRRIADPSTGARLTGKIGPYALGAMLIDDEAPGKRVEPGDPLAGERAWFGVLRATRDVSKQSVVGFLYTERRLGDGRNRVGGFDGRIRLGDNWSSQFQAVHSSTRTLEGERLDDGAYSLAFNRSGRKLDAHVHYLEIGPEFETQSGFVNRVDVRTLHQDWSYTFRPEGRRLIGPQHDLVALLLSFQLDPEAGLGTLWRVRGPLGKPARRARGHGLGR